MSSIHAQRAKRWGTNPFIAEWLANAVEFCHRNPAGKAAFEKWVTNHHGPVQGKLDIKACHMPASKRYAKPSNAAHFWNAGVELGVSVDAIKLYHLYTSSYDLCTPERVVPGPKRRRGESSVDWLARRHLALLDGTKTPNFDWQTARAIAISEADRVRDLSETWRTNPTVFLNSIRTRGESTIPSPEILDRDPEYKKFHTMNDALRSLMYIHTLAHMTWSHAVELFEDLATLGLTTPSSIERAYRKDTKLLWRLCACIANTVQLYNAMLGKFTHVVTYSPHFRPYFKRWRQSDGVARVKKNREYIEKHGFGGSIMDETIVSMFDEINNKASAFFDMYTRALQTNPEEANKFSQEAYDEMGDLAIVHEFHVNMFESSFGQRLREYARAKQLDATFFTEVIFMDPTRFNHTPYELPNRSIGQASIMTAAMCDRWLHCTQRLSIWEMLPTLCSSAGPIYFDEMWLTIDLQLWKLACEMLDRPTEPGRVAKTFGLIDPFDDNRPTFEIGRIFQDVESDEEDEPEPETTPAPAANPDAIPKFPAANTVAQSVHSYLAGTQEDRPKEKVKTRGTVTLDTQHSSDSEDGWSDGEEGGLWRYPLVLPPNFKMGRNVLKIFHRILDDRNEVNGDSKDAPKKGQIRWGDFEKAMKRIWFSVIQTAGSSVRFDPPAQTARPITFHRPHPDSTMSPILIKWRVQIFLDRRDMLTIG